MAMFAFRPSRRSHNAQVALRAERSVQPEFGDADKRRAMSSKRPEIHDSDDLLLTLRGSVHTFGITGLKISETNIIGC